MIKAQYKDCNHAVMTGYILSCPSCKHERAPLKGVNVSTGKPAWFLGCLCPIPDGIVMMRPRRVADEVVDALRMMGTVKLMVERAS